MQKSQFEKYLGELKGKWTEWVRIKDLLQEGLIGSETQMHNLLKKGQGPSYVKVGGRILFLKEDVLKWIKKGYKQGEK